MKGNVRGDSSDKIDHFVVVVSLHVEKLPQITSKTVKCQISRNLTNNIHI